MKVYISGPISGLDLASARASFARAEGLLKAQGYTPINPMNNGLCPNSDWSVHMKRDLQMLLECEGIYMLPNHNSSRGAILEHTIARELGLKFINNPQTQRL